MGTEQSTQRERVTREGLTQREVERVSEQQRRIYEQRCKELLQSQTNTNARISSNLAQQQTTSVKQTEIRTQTNQRNNVLGSTTHQTTPINAASQPSASSSHETRPTEPRTQTNKLNNLFASTTQKTTQVNAASQPSASSSNVTRLPPTTPVTTSNVAPKCPPPAARNNVASPTLDNSGLERHRTPYSFTRDNLPSPVQSTSSPQNLYPNLNNNRNSTQPPRNNDLFSFPNARNATANRNSNLQRPSDFVFVNNNGEAERIVPSAPAPPRDRSVSRSRARRTDDEVSCPTCHNSFGLNIYQCSSGHSSCKDCKMRSAPCGICRQTITDMRNITLEAYISERKVECPNASDGCRLVFKLADMENHMKECPFKEMQCPVPSNIGVCNWRGKISQMATHFDEVHPCHRQGDVDTELFLLNICNNSQILYCVVIGSYNFLFHVKVSEEERKIYMAVQLMGTKVSASKWNYEIHVYNKRQPRRKYQYSDNCRSSAEPIGDIFRDSSCAVLPLSYAMTFINEGSLTYKFYIKKEEKEKREGQRDFNSNYRGRGRGRGRGAKHV